MSLLRFQNLSHNDSEQISSYFVASTAPLNVEDKVQIDSEAESKHLNQIIAKIYEKIIKNPQESAEIVIAIHGYNTPKESVQEWHQDIMAYINNDPYIKEKKDKTIFLGYRWPSETIGNKDLRKSIIKSMPYPLQWLGITGIFLIVLFTFLIPATIFAILPLLIASFILLLVVTLAILKETVYFRDSYRANNFGVSDLVELIRQIDARIFNLACEAEEQDKEIYIWPNERRIKLTFIAHSMGSFVTTNTVRILSDVFDIHSIGKLDIDDSEKQPQGNIGNVFCLEKLILVAPDISIETIIWSRANFLRSSLRRFKEAYLFSNEGDLALRLASPIANYFSFPTKTRNQGYRLGNVAVMDNTKKYGILNFSKDIHSSELCKSSLPYLFISSFDSTTSCLKNIQDNLKKEDSQKTENVADIFTYFDCTDYQDKTDYPGKQGQIVKVVCPRQSKKNHLTLWDYILTIKGYFFSQNGYIDVHGGYFQGEFTKKAIYRIAFLGFAEFLDSLESPQNIPQIIQEKINDIDKGSIQLKNEKINPDLAKNRLLKLAKFMEDCDRKQIKVLLSQERYKLDILGIDRNQTRQETLKR